MAKAVWNGFLRLSLVSCPVHLSPATRDSNDIRLEQLNERTGNPVTEQFVDTKTGDVVPAYSLVKGHQGPTGAWATISGDELAKLAGEPSNMFELAQFVPRDRIERTLLDAPYYVYPEGQLAADTVHALRLAMIRSARAGVCRIHLDGRTRFAVVEPHGAGLMLSPLRNPPDMEPPEFIERADSDIPTEMVEIVEAIIDRRASEFDPATFRDTYEDDLRALIEEKSGGRSRSGSAGSGSGGVGSGGLGSGGGEPPHQEPPPPPPPPAPAAVEAAPSSSDRPDALASEESAAEAAVPPQPAPLPAEAAAPPPEAASAEPEAEIHAEAASAPAEAAARTETASSPEGLGRWVPPPWRSMGPPPVPASAAAEPSPAPEPTPEPSLEPIPEPTSAVEAVPQTMVTAVEPPAAAAASTQPPESEPEPAAHEEAGEPEHELEPEAEEATGPDELGTEILLHIMGLGDRRYVEPGWAGHPGSRRQIEAISIRPRDDMAPSTVEFRVFAQEGRATAWVSNGNYAGTRGRGLPLTGFAVRPAPELRDQLDIVYEGCFFEGGVVGPKRNGEVCASPVGDDPLEAIRVQIYERQPE